MRIFSSAVNCRRVARRISFTTCSAGFLTGPDFFPIFAPFNCYDWAENLPSSTHPICIIGADAGHSVNETTELAEVATLLETKGIKRVPVLNDGKLVGIISRANLVRALAATESAVLTLSHSEEEAIRNRVLDESIRRRLIEELGQLKWVDHLTDVIVKNQ